MTLLTESMSSTGLVPLDTTIEVLLPELVANPHLAGVSTLDWSAATVTETVAGRMEPAGTRALERAGRIGKAGVHELCSEPVGLVPQGRVRVGAQQYAVIDVREYAPFTYAIVEEVEAGTVPAEPEPEPEPPEEPEPEPEGDP